jgi:hypothetical protein
VNVQELAVKVLEWAAKVPEKTPQNQPGGPAGRPGSGQVADHIVDMSCRLLGAPFGLSQVERSYPEWSSDHANGRINDSSLEASVAQT